MKRRLSLQQLERKDVPSGNPIPPGISLNAYGTLYVNGDANDQICRVWVAADGQVHASTAHAEYVPDGTGGFRQVIMPDDEKAFDPTKVKRINMYGHEGNDQLTNDTALPSTLVGSDGSDELVGGSGNDVILGNAGDDVLEGRGGDDDLRGGAGSDVYVFQSGGVGAGGLGWDKVMEAANVDTDRLDFNGLGGGAGIVINLASTAQQVVKGAYLKITLSDGLGIEEVWGTAAADTIKGNGRANSILGFGGPDTVFGGGGADSIDGGTGADSIDGGAGNDQLTGWDGNDTITGGLNDDSIDGGAGNDNLDGGSGNDTVVGGADQDVLTGATGNDVLSGGFGTDNLDGGAGNDSVSGGDGNDSVNGGAGNDHLNGDDGDDNLDGGTGKDTMDGGVGYDSLLADQGNETLSNGEHVEITVPSDSPQTNGWSCGPNSASRLLRSYGFTSATYGALMVAAQKTNIMTEFGLGTPPPYLLQVLQKYRASSQLESGADFNDVLARLGEGRPVIALIGWGSRPVPSPDPLKPIDLVPEALHYICLTGYDLTDGKLYFTDTNGEAGEMTFAKFQEYWNWTADGLAYDGLAALGIKKQTILW